MTPQDTTAPAFDQQRLVLPCCSKCSRQGILICQYVMPNKWSEPRKSFVREPWVFRSYLCRYHLAAENNPRTRKLFGGTNRRRLSFRADAELIAEWQRQNAKLRDAAQ